MGRAMVIADLIFLTMTMLLGEEGEDWAYYLDYKPYWRLWVYKNRN